MERSILVTGSSSGIGRAISQHLLTAGHNVLGVARNFAKSPCDHPRFSSISIDLGDLDALPRKLPQVVAQGSAVDALICNAGQGRFGNLEQFSYAQIRALLDLNFTSHAYLVRAFLPQLKKTGGDIVFIGSEAALQGAQKGSIYCASKFALRGFAQALRQECSRNNIRVALVNPGMVDTPFFDELDFAPGSEPDQHITPADVAQAVGLILAARPGTVIDEINLSPQKNVINFNPDKPRT